MKKILVFITAVLLLSSMVGCDFFGPELDLVDVKDLPSFDSQIVDSKDAALVAVFNSGILLSFPMQSLGEKIGIELDKQMGSVPAAILSQYLAPSFTLAANRAINWEDNFTEGGDLEKGSESGDFSLEITDEMDAGGFIQLDATADGEFSSNWDYSGSREKADMDADGDVDFTLRVLKNITAETVYGDTVVLKSGSLAHFIASVDFDIDMDVDTEAVEGKIVSNYDSRIQFGYTMTIDGIDKLSGKFVLIIDIKEKSNANITFASEEDLLSQLAEDVSGEFESYGTLKVYDNSNTLVYDIDLTDDALLEILEEM